MALEFKGKLAEFMDDTTREIDIEGALSSGKTTACLVKMRRAIEDFPGVECFIFRYSGTDTDTKLRPAFEKICLSEYPNALPKWDAKELVYDFPNGSICYAFGIKAVDKLSRYSKLRGLGVARIYNDQTEELPKDLGEELRSRMRQPGYAHQLIFSPNPPGTDSWIAKQFPENPAKILPGRKLYQISLYDNAHNLPAEMISGSEAAFPVEHAKHKAVIMGQRGPNVIGESIYENTFKRSLHVQPVTYNPDQVLLEGFEFGKKNPAWVCAQRRYHGGLAFLGGIIGEGMFLEDFLPVVKQYRREWFPRLTRENVRTCATMSQSLAAVTSTRFTGLSVLRENELPAQWRDNTNSPDVVQALIERFAGYMRRRTVTGEESLIVNSDDTHWLKVSREGIEPCPFIAQAFEAGYVWDEHTVSVSNNEVRQPKADDWFEHGMRCCEAIELHFCADQPTDAQRQARAQQARDREQMNNPATASGPASWMGR